MCADTCSAEAARGHWAWKQCVFVRAQDTLAMPTVTSHTIKLALLSSFTAHCVLFTGRSVMLWEATKEISSEVKFRGLSYPSESLGNSPTVYLIKTHSLLQLNLFLLPLSTRWTTMHNSCKAVTSVCGPQTTETILWDWLFPFVPVFSSWTAPGQSVVFLVRTFQGRVTLKIIDMAKVFTTVSALSSSQWEQQMIHPLAYIIPNQPNCHILTSQIIQTSAAQS